MSNKHHLWPCSDSCFFIAIAILCLAFCGEPDLTDALIEWIKKQE